MSMKYTQLGRSGLSVSTLCLGTMNFGPHTDEADAFKIMDQAHEAGLNFLTRPTVTVAMTAAAGLRRSLAVGLPRAEAGASGPYWPPRSTPT